MKHLITTLLFFSVVCIPATAQYGRTQYGRMRLRPQIVHPIIIVDITSAIGLSNVSVPYSHTMAGFTAAQGIQIDERLIIALGTGFLFYNGGLLTPLFLDFRYRYYTYSKYTVYYFGNGGFLFNNAQHFEYSKMYLNPGAGLKYEFTRNFSANFGLGLLVQQGLRRDSFINFKLGISYVIR